MSEQEQRYLKPYDKKKKDKKIIIVNKSNIEMQETDISEINLLKEELAQVIVKYERRLATAESKIKELEKQIEGLQDVPSKAETTENHVKPDKGNQERTSVEKRYFVVPRFGFEYDGWVYYPNEKMGNFLYRVSLDGRYREQLTGYSVIDPELWSVREGKLFFTSAEGKQRSIEI